MDWFFCCVREWKKVSHSHPSKPLVAYFSSFKALDIVVKFHLRERWEWKTFFVWIESKEQIWFICSCSIWYLQCKWVLIPPWKFKVNQQIFAHILVRQTREGAILNLSLRNFFLFLFQRNQQIFRFSWFSRYYSGGMKFYFALFQPIIFYDVKACTKSKLL